MQASDYISLGWKAPENNRLHHAQSVLQGKIWNLKNPQSTGTVLQHRETTYVSRQCRRGLSIQCLESPSLPATTTTSPSTTTISSSAAPLGDNINPVDGDVSGWDDQMEVLNLKECTSYTCKVSYPRVDEVGSPSPWLIRHNEMVIPDDFVIETEVANARAFNSFNILGSPPTRASL